jgi:hypothetical protein
VKGASSDYLRQFDYIAIAESWVSAAETASP